MKHHPVFSAVLALGGFALTACGDNPTQPNLSDPVSPAPNFAIASNTWLTRADMWSIERWDLTTATVTNAAGQSVVYAIGGQSAAGGPLGKVMAYNVATNTWTLKAPLPMPLWDMNPAAVVDNKIYVSGGCRWASSGYWCFTEGHSSYLFMYDPATNRWTQKQFMPDWGATGVTGVIKDKIYVVTTCFEADPMEYYFPDCEQFGGGEPPTSRFFRYNPTTDRWVTLPRPHHMYHMGGVLYDKLYVTDGLNVEVYDPATNQWTIKRQGPRERRDAAVAVLGAKLYLIGGIGFSDGWEDTLLTTTVYHPLSDTWSTAAPLPAARTRVSATRVYLNGRARIQLVGGRRPGNNLQYVP